MNDPIQEFYFRCRDWCEAMPDKDYWSIVRLMMVVAFPTILCGWAFKNGSRTSLIQIIFLTAGVLLGLIIPFARPPGHPDVKAWTLVFSGVLLILAPAILPFFLTRRYGLQKKLRVILYCGLAVVLLMEIL